MIFHEDLEKRFLEGNEIKEFREYIGKINWVAQMTDPTVAYIAHELSTKISEAKVDDLKRLRKILGKLKESPKSVIFRKLSEDPYSEDLKVLTYSDQVILKEKESQHQKWKNNICCQQENRNVQSN